MRVGPANLHECDFETLCQTGERLAASDRLREAAEWFREALRRNSQSLRATVNLASALARMKRYQESIELLEAACQAAPDLPELLNNLGIVYFHVRRFDEALRSFDRAIELHPQYRKAFHNRSITLIQLGRFDEGESHLRRALEISPDAADSRFELAMLQLLRGDWESGWEAYESRFDMAYESRFDRAKENDVRQRYANAPWTGQPLEGRTILVWLEQGLGDTIQFIRFARRLQEMGARVIVEAPHRLIPLLRNCSGVDLWVRRGETLPEADYQVPLLSLPRLLGLRPGSIPQDVPYLTADEGLTRAWSPSLAALSGFRVGIVWQGSPSYPLDALRSVPLAEFAPLARVPNVRLISLQQHLGLDQLAGVADLFPVTTLDGDVDVATGAFMDTAAIMRNLDLIVSSDTSAVHLAGALGCPCWVALGRVPEWRWQLDRPDTPWYPTVRLFRQATHGVWRDVFTEMAAELHRHVESAAAGSPGP